MIVPPPSLVPYRSVRGWWERSITTAVHGVAVSRVSGFRRVWGPV